MNRQTTKRLFGAGIVLIAAAIIVGYSYITSYGLIDGPTITILDPKSTAMHGNIYAEVSTSSIVLQGVAERTNNITLNGRNIIIDPQGNFSETLLLFPGQNIETLVGQDRFGRTTTVRLEFAYDSQ